MLGAISPFLGHLQLPTPQHDDVALQRKKRSLDSTHSHLIPSKPITPHVTIGAEAAAAWTASARGTCSRAAYGGQPAALRTPHALTKH